jgi:hypothetical protein
MVFIPEIIFVIREWFNPERGLVICTWEPWATRVHARKVYANYFPQMRQTYNARDAPK